MLSAPPNPRRQGAEAGSGLLSATFGVVIFCGFLLVAAQVLLTLHRTTLVASAAADSAQAAAQAHGPGDHLCDATAVATAVARAHALLGPAISATATCEGASISVEVAAPRPRLVGSFGTPTINRTATARLETRTRTT